ncbi:MAG: hypothetical protein IPK07_08480 [Deltaproteobacteria bacterium]|nr:hypothetical protein [Deltaproteobacteria bacterium]
MATGFSKDRSNIYFWFDSEYTTLELDKACLLQVALVITDSELKRLTTDPGLSMYVRLPPGHEPAAWVKENQADVLKGSAAQGLPVLEVDRRLAQYVDNAIGPPGDSERFRPILAGNSIHSDWILVRRFLPEFVRRMNYRLLDVTGLKLQWDQYWKGDRFDKDTPEQIRRFFPEAQLDATSVRHDAFFDAQASIAELAYYRSRLEMRR